MAPKELSNLAGLLRSGHRGAIDEDGFSRVGADSNLFHQGAAKESEDPELVSATVASPVSSTPPRGVGGPTPKMQPCPTDLPDDKGQPQPKRESPQAEKTAARKKRRQGSPQGRLGV
jgi:colicin import membrane protein